MEQTLKPEQKETREATSRIVLKFFRHGQKESTKEIADNDILLTEQGRATAMSKAEVDSIEQSVAFGSPRIRTQETAILKMAGKSEDITGNESLDELKEKINDERKYGSKIRTSSHPPKYRHLWRYFNTPLKNTFGRRYRDSTTSAKAVPKPKSTSSPLRDRF